MTYNREDILNPHTIYKYNFDTLTTCPYEEKLSKLEQVRYIEHPDNFFKETAYCRRVDGKLSHYHYFSQINPSKKTTLGSGYLVHGLSIYKGNFHGQMVRALINFCNLPQDAVILDSFSGSGTTLVEAALLGFRSIGLDINPIACLYSKVKPAILNTPVAYLMNDNTKYFDLNYYTKFLINVDFNKLLNVDIKDLFYLFLYVRAVSDASRIAIPVKNAFYNNYTTAINTLNDFSKLKTKLAIKSVGIPFVFFGDNYTTLRQFDSNSIDAIIESPPYIDALDYIQNDVSQISLFFNGSHIKEMKARSIGNKVKNKEYTEKLYWKNTGRLLEEKLRILKSGCYLISVVGYYSNMHEKLIELAKQIGFEIDFTVVKPYTNRRGQYVNEYILFFSKQ